MGKDRYKLVANNKKAYHDYFIDETYEAGVALHGTEVKSVRMGKCSVKESFIRIENGEVIAYGLHISPYEKGNIFNRAVWGGVSMTWEPSLESSSMIYVPASQPVTVKDPFSEVR